MYTLLMVYIIDASTSQKIIHYAGTECMYALRRLFMLKHCNVLHQKWAPFSFQIDGDL